MADTYSIAFKTLGCRLNQAEEADFARQFIDIGWKLADETESDVIVLHSCAVTRAAERETFRYIRAVKRRANPPVLVVTGCAVACNSVESFQTAGADLTVSKVQTSAIADIVVSFLTKRAASHSVSVENPFSSELPLFTTKRALLKIQDGCDMRCAYCIVPSTRGHSISRPWTGTLDAAKAILDAGFHEIVMTGCNLACYSDSGHNLADVTDAVCGLAAVAGARVRLGSVEPSICDDEIMSVMLANANLCRFIHFPIQSGDSRVLAAMGRHYSAERIFEVLENFRLKMPLLSINGDMITGLPGEDEDAFARTCSMVEHFEFANVHVFPYSPRQGTRAPSMAGCPSRFVAKARAERLREVAFGAGEAYRRRLIGVKTTVLIEGRDAKGMAYGWNEAHVQCRLQANGVPAASLASFIPSRIDNLVLS